MMAEQSIFFWRFSLDPENDENEHPNQEPKAKKMRTKSPNGRSMSQHMSDQAWDGLEMRIGERKKAAEDRLLSVNANLEKAVEEGNKAQAQLVGEKKMLLERLAEQTRKSEKAQRDLREETQKKLEDGKVDQETREKEMKQLEENLRTQRES